MDAPGVVRVVTLRRTVNKIIREGGGLTDKKTLLRRKLSEIDAAINQLRNAESAITAALWLIDGE